ncbi:hypothetical protein [Motiliproteus sediminis]|uniref:hypothetical protein n=1 Tax=Motiliproteus sediminis TaxID=1468178 RepID=UPI001AF0065F|nr:hypothetical protein [Motiliproteus sediminis]
MLTYEDCLELSGSCQEEVDAIAEHDHLYAIQALAEAACLLQQRGGCQRLRQIIIDDIRKAQIRGDRDHEHALRILLTKVIREHPQQRVA